jgi:diaminopimelate decarboxylase
MDAFAYRDGRLCAEEVPLPSLAEEVGTPAYVYSKAALLARYDEIADAFAPTARAAGSPPDAAASESTDRPGESGASRRAEPHETRASPASLCPIGADLAVPDPLICYSVKANSNLALLDVMRARGSGFDVVSGGELYRALKVGADPHRIVFAGVGKTDGEIRFGLTRGILVFNVESRPELERIDHLAREMGRRARVTLRVNPDVDPRTHRYIATGKKETKFGIDFERAAETLAGIEHLGGVELCGLHMHIGSQILETEPYRAAIEKLVAFADEERGRGRPIHLLNVGGGFGIDYQGQGARPLAEYAAAVAPAVRSRGYGLLLEPGRSIVGNAGVLLTRVLYVKRSGEKRFVICDAGMNHLIRPALYGSFHRIWPVAAGGLEGEPGAPPLAGEADIVGPICESGDFFAKDRPFPEVAAGDLLAVFSAGAYGMSMASNYNSQPRPVEVLVDGARRRVVRRRETYDELVAAEVEAGALA